MDAARAPLYVSWLTLFWVLSFMLDIAFFLSGMGLVHYYGGPERALPIKLPTNWFAKTKKSNKKQRVSTPPLSPSYCV